MEMSEKIKSPPSKTWSASGAAELTIHFNFSVHETILHLLLNFDIWIIKKYAAWAHHHSEQSIRQISSPFHFFWIAYLGTALLINTFWWSKKNYMNSMRFTQNHYKEKNSLHFAIFVS